MARKFKRSQVPPKKLALSWPELKAEVARLSGVGNYAGALELLETRPPGEEGQQLWKETYQRRLEHLLDRGKAGEAAQRAAEGLKLEPNWQALEYLLTRARALQGDWDGVFRELHTFQAPLADTDEAQPPLRLPAVGQSLRAGHSTPGSRGYQWVHVRPGCGPRLLFG